MVVDELQVPVAHCLLVLALQPLGLPRVGGLGVEHVEQMSREPPQFGGVVGRREAHHQLLCLDGGLGRKVVGQAVQDVGDRLGLRRQDGAGRGCRADQPEPIEALPGQDQPGGFAPGQVRRLRQPRTGGGAVLVPRGLADLDLGREPGLPGSQSGFDPQRRGQQAELLGLGREPQPVVEECVKAGIDHTEQLGVAEPIEPVLHIPTLRVATDISSGPQTVIHKG